MRKLQQRLLLTLVLGAGVAVVTLSIFRPTNRAVPTGRLGGACVPNAQQSAPPQPPNPQPARTDHDMLGFAHDLLNGKGNASFDHQQVWPTLRPDEVQHRLTAMRDDGIAVNEAQGGFSTIRITGWRGWIAAISPGLYAESKDSYTVNLYLDDPFAGVPPTDANASPSDSYGDIELCCIGTSDARALSVGQQVVFCGGIALWSTGPLTVEAPVINPIESADAMTGQPLPADFHLHYEEHGCGDGYTCPDYSIEIAADGGVIYQGESGVRVAGQVTSQADTKKLWELARLVEQAALFTPDLVPNPTPIQARGSTLLTVTMNGQHKTSAWSWEDTIPHRAQILRAKVKEVANVWPWIRLWPELNDD